MKKTLSIVLSLVLLFSAIPSFAVSSSEALQTLIAYGIIKGDGTGYMEDQVLQRQNAAIILCRLMGVEEEAKATDPTGLVFEDLQDKMHRETTRIIAYTFNKTWFRGMSTTEFGWGQNITVQQFATIMLRALGYDPAFATAYETAADMGLFNGTSGLQKKDPIIRNDVYIAMYNTLNTVPNGETKPLKEILGLTQYEDLKVESIKAEGLKVISVKFNKEFVAGLGSSVSVTKNGSSIIGSGAQYHYDRNTILIYLPSPAVQNDTVTVKIQGIKDLEGNVLDTVVQNVTFLDNKAPVVTGIDVVNQKTIVVKTTEPLDYGSSSYSYHNEIKIDGSPKLSRIHRSYFNEIVIELQNELTAGDHTIEISGISDYAGFPIEDYQGTFNVVPDNEAPQLVEMMVVNNKQLKAVFDETLYAKGNFTVQGYNVANVTKDDNEVNIYLSNKLGLDALAELIVKYKGQKDAIGNEIVDEQTVTITAPDDTTSPTVELTNVEKGALEIGFELTFSEGIYRDVPVDPNFNQVSFKDDHGTVIPTTMSNVQWNHDAKVMKFTVQEFYNLDAKTFQIVLNKFRDNSIRMNEMPETSIEFTCPDTKAPKVVGVATASAKQYYADGNTITIKFSEPMDESSLANVSNYRIYKTSIHGGAFLHLLSDIDGAAINIINDKEVQITVDDINDIKYTQGGASEYPAFKLEQVTDVAGNLLLNSEIVRGIPTAPELAVVSGVKQAFLKKANDEYYLEVLFDKPVKVFDNDGIKYGSDVLEQQFIGQQYEYMKSLTFKVPSTVTIDEGADNLGLGVNVVFAPNSVMSEYGIKNNINLKIDSDGTGTEFIDKVAPAMIDEPEFLANNKTIELEYSEPIKLTTNIQSCTVVLDNQILPISGYSVNNNDGVVRVQLQQPLSQSHSGKTVVLSIQVKDNNDNTVGLITKNIPFTYQP